MDDLFTAEQQQGVEWLRARGAALLADAPGLGKTRQLLKACEGMEINIVCPAAIRDAHVWPTEAAKIGLDQPINVLSYHGFAKLSELPSGAWIFDEAHRLKNKTSWTTNALKVARTAEKVLLATGTPTPNGRLHELYYLLRMINPATPKSYWKWVREWFVIEPNRFTQYFVSGRLLNCVHTGESCEHRDDFWEANLGGLALRRLVTGLPSVVGEYAPMLAPMTATQARAYRDMRRELIADLPETGITLEAMSSSKRFAMLRELATGLSNLDAAQPLTASGKYRLARELLSDKETPSLLIGYHKNTIRELQRLCEADGLSHVLFTASMTGPQREEAVRVFQNGDTDVFIGSLGAIKEGLTLTAADEVILVERSDVPGDMEQVVRRALRRGQTKTVAVRQLVAPGTVDELQWDRLTDKNAEIKPLMTKAEAASLL